MIVRGEKVTLGWVGYVYQTIYEVHLITKRDNKVQAQKNWKTLLDSFKIDLAELNVQENDIVQIYVSATHEEETSAAAYFQQFIFTAGQSLHFEDRADPEDEIFEIQNQIYRKELDNQIASLEARASQFQTSYEQKVNTNLTRELENLRDQ